MFHISFYITVEIISAVHTPFNIVTYATAFVRPIPLLQAHNTCVKYVTTTTTTASECLNTRITISLILLHEILKLCSCE